MSDIFDEKVSCMFLTDIQTNLAEAYNHFRQTLCVGRKAFLLTHSANYDIIIVRKRGAKMTIKEYMESLQEDQPSPLHDGDVSFSDLMCSMTEIWNGSASELPHG